MDDTLPISRDPARGGRRPLPLAILVAARPRQWAKNGALLAPLLFSLRATDPSAAWRAALGVVAFCLLASATYLGNDLLDRERDALHPLKRRRPIPAGELSVPVAIGAALLLAIAALLLAFALGLPFLTCAVSYLALQFVYSTTLKNVVVLDVFAIATGFVLRVIAGAEAIAVPISNWLYLCTLLLALFLALGKRRAELELLADEAGEHRPILTEYSVHFIDQLLTVVSACTILAYALYTLAADTIERFGSDRLKYTIPFVLFGMFRYLYLIHRRGEGGQPERVLLRDRTTQLNLVGYLAVVAWALYLKG